jgi:hypothetical protein
VKSEELGNCGSRVGCFGTRSLLSPFQRGAEVIASRKTLYHIGTLIAPPG